MRLFANSFRRSLVAEMLLQAWAIRFLKRRPNNQHLSVPAKRLFWTMWVGYILRISSDSHTGGEHAVVAWEMPKAVGIRLNSSNGKTLNPNPRP